MILSVHVSLPLLSFVKLHVHVLLADNISMMSCIINSQFSDNMAQYQHLSND